MLASFPHRSSVKLPISVAALLLGVAFGGCGGDEPGAPPEVASDEISSKKTGSITVVLEMRPEISTEVLFAFENKNFGLVDDAGASLSNTRTFEKLKAGTYTVEMTSAPDGPLTHILCESSGIENNTTDLANRTATITLEAGESVVCTFVDGWETGDLVTHSQSAWGAAPTPSNAAGLLHANYDSVYAATFGVFEIGIPGAAGFSVMFSDQTYLGGYLPASGTSGPLTGDLVDPQTTPAGEFGGHVAALKLNVDFSDAGLTLGASAIPFGDLVLCNSSTLPLLNGMTVRQFLGVVNTLLGGGTADYTIDQVCPFGGGFIEALTLSFASGVPATFAIFAAQDNLFIGACP